MFFPQLESFAMAQYPLREQRYRRTVVAQTEGGETWRFPDPAGTRVVWRLTLNALRDTERAAIDSLFLASAGSLREFTFLDPSENLLRYSEDFAQSSWVRNGGMSVAGGQGDPWGTTRATTVVNPSVEEQRLFQLLPIPSGYYYHLSVYARSPVPANVGISIQSPSSIVRRDLALTTNWTRYSVTGSPGGPSGETEAGLHVPSGGTIEIAAMQLEAQLGASTYRPTAAKSGIHPEARFLDDKLQWITHASDVHDTVIQIVGY